MGLGAHLSVEPMGFAEGPSMERRVEVRADKEQPQGLGLSHGKGRAPFTEKGIPGGGFWEIRAQSGRVQSQRPNDVLKAMGHIDLELWKLELGRKMAVQRR